MEDENSRSYTEDIDEEGSEKPSVDSEEKAAEEEDMLSRVIVGSRTSIFSTLLLVAVITVLGTAVGVFCGWNGRWMDTVLMRISDMFLAFPGLVFALAVAGSLGGGLQNAILALAAISWPKYARIARSQTLAQKETVWMKAAKLSGSSSGKLIFKHILPNIIGPNSEKKCVKTWIMLSLSL